MSDIFISYASEDRTRAEILASALEQQGWSVWWDRSIPAGKTFDKVIEEAIDAARCVMVLWSNVSVASRWVSTEAEEGARRDILVPVLIEQAKIPLAFRRIQAADLTGWDGDISEANFIKLVADLTEILGPSPTTVEEKKRPQEEVEYRRRAEEVEQNTTFGGKRKADEEERQQTEAKGRIELEARKKGEDKSGKRIAPKTMYLVLGIVGIAIVITAGIYMMNRPSPETDSTPTSKVGEVAVEKKADTIAIDVTSKDDGKILRGTMTYSTEGPIGFMGQMRGENAGSNYTVKNQWGGDSAPWHSGGTWVIGARNGKQNVVALKVKSSDNGKTLVGTNTYAGEGPISFKGVRNNGTVYDVENSWGGTSGHDGGAWVLGVRANKKQYVVAIDIKSSDNGKTFTGTMTYAGEGAIGFKAKNTAGNGYDVELQWGGSNAPWHPDGQWLIGGRDQKCVVVSAKSSDGGKTLVGNMTYSGEGPIGFNAKIVGGNGYDVQNQWGGSNAPWHPGGVWVFGSR